MTNVLKAEFTNQDKHGYRYFLKKSVYTFTHTQRPVCQWYTQIQYTQVTVDVWHGLHYLGTGETHNNVVLYFGHTTVYNWYTVVLLY